MTRCERRDKGKTGCVRNAGHRGACAIRPDAAGVYAAGDYRPRIQRRGVAGDFPCTMKGCKGRVKHEGARCASCRGRMRNQGRGRATLLGGRDPSPAALSGSPSPALASTAALPAGSRLTGQAPMSAVEVIANLTARKVLAGLARAIQKMLAGEC